MAGVVLGSFARIALVFAVLCAVHDIEAVTVALADYDLVVRPGGCHLHGRERCGRADRSHGKVA